MKKIYGFAFASAALMLASCSSDAPEVNNPSLEEGESAYVKLSLGGIVNETRSLENGEAINSVTFHFEGNGQSKDIEVNGTTGDNKFITNAANADKTAVVKLGFVPSKVRAVVNGKEASTLTATNGVPANLAIMSSATRYVDGTASEWTAVPQAAVYFSSEAAEKGTPITINVDRCYAQVKIDAKTVTVNLAGKGFSGYDITFTPKIAWVNGVATTASLYKGLPTNLKIQGKDLTQALINNATANYSSHWAAATSWTWKNTQHYSLNDMNKDAYKVANVVVGNVYENTPSNAGVTKDFTHIIVAGQYTLTPQAGATPLPDGWDGTFYQFGTKDGKPVIYLTEDAVKRAMGATDPSKAELVQKKELNDGKTTSKFVLKVDGKEGNLSCIKFHNSWVYYAREIYTPFGTGNDAFNLNGVVRNHRYALTVKNIKGMGIPVQDPTEPIIPEIPTPDGDEVYMQISVVVNPFVETGQDVDWNNGGLK